MYKPWICGALIYAVLVGLLIGFGPKANAVDIQLTGISARDVLAAAALCGMVSRGPLVSHCDVANEAYKYADACMVRRQLPVGR